MAVTCTYCGHELKKHEVIDGVGVECKVCVGICGDFHLNPTRKKKVKPLLQLIKENT